MARPRPARPPRPRPPLRLAQRRQDTEVEVEQPPRRDYRRRAPRRSVVLYEAEVLGRGRDRRGYVFTGRDGVTPIGADLPLAVVQRSAAPRRSHHTRAKDEASQAKSTYHEPQSHGRDAHAARRQCPRPSSPVNSGTRRAPDHDRHVRAPASTTAYLTRRCSVFAPLARKNEIGSRKPARALPGTLPGRGRGGGHHPQPRINSGSAGCRSGRTGRS